MQNKALNSREHAMFDELYDFFDIAEIKNQDIDEINMKSRLRKRIYRICENLQIERHQWITLTPSEKKAFINALINDQFFLKALVKIHDPDSTIDEFVSKYINKASINYCDEADSEYLPIFYKEIADYQEFLQLLDQFNKCYTFPEPIPALSESTYYSISKSRSIYDYVLDYENTWYEIYSAVEHTTNINEFSSYEIEVHKLISQSIVNTNIDREITQVLTALFDTYFGIKINTERIRADILSSKIYKNRIWGMTPAEIVNTYCEESRSRDIPNQPIEKFENIEFEIENIKNDILKIKQILNRTRK